MPIYFLFVYALLKNYLNPEEPVNSIVLKFAVFFADGLHHTCLFLFLADTDSSPKLVYFHYMPI